jgi:hypothetical protein
MILVSCCGNREPDEEGDFVEEGFDYFVDRGSVRLLAAPWGDGLEQGRLSAQAQARGDDRH